MRSSVIKKLGYPTAFLKRISDSTFLDISNIGLEELEFSTERILTEEERIYINARFRECKSYKEAWKCCPISGAFRHLGAEDYEKYIVLHLTRFWKFDGLKLMGKWPFENSKPTQEDSIYALNLNRNILCTLGSAGILTIGDICSYSRTEILTEKNQIGQMKLREIEAALHRYGFSLREE